MTEGINEIKVTAFMKACIPDLAEPVDFSLITGGHSNLTFRCEDSKGKSYVLRRPPLGHVLESAHDMGREHKIVSALKDSDVPVARTYGLCMDKETNEAPFYLMEYVDGLVLNDSQIGEQLPETSRKSLGLEVIEILSRLHLIDPDKVGLGDLGRKEAYLARQLKRWTRQWEASKTHEIVEMEESCRLLTEKMPEQIGATIVHGDYRLGNMIVSGNSIKAVLDWELCTLGDSLADVGYLLNNWMSPEEVVRGEGDQAPTAVGGYPSTAELCAVYQKNTGRHLDGINYYRAFSHWRLAAIGQGVYKRYLMGAMGESRDVDLDKQKEGVSKRAAAAMELLSSGV